MHLTPDRHGLVRIRPMLVCAGTLGLVQSASAAPCAWVVSPAASQALYDKLRAVTGGDCTLRDQSSKHDVIEQVWQGTQQRIELRWQPAACQSGEGGRLAPLELQRFAASCPTAARLLTERSAQPDWPAGTRALADLHTTSTYDPTRLPTRVLQVAVVLALLAWAWFAASGRLRVSPLPTMPPAPLVPQSVRERRLGGALLGLVVFKGIETAIESVGEFIDFPAYYWAAATTYAGLNPLDWRDVSRVSGLSSVMPYKYPPLLAWVFLPLTAFDYATAALIWLVMTLAAFAAVGFVVSTRVLGRGLDPFFWAVVLLAWPYCVTIAIRSGNIEIYSQLAIWLAVAAWLDNRSGRFTFWVVIAALPKVVSGSVACIPMAVGGRRARLATSAALTAVAAWFALNAWAAPVQWQKWLGIVGTTVEPGVAETSTSPSLFWLTSAALGHGRPAQITTLLVSLAILAATGLVLRRGRGLPPVASTLLLFTALQLLAPRMKDYGYLSFLPPAAWLARSLWHAGGRPRWLVKIWAGALVFGAAFVPPPTEAAATTSIAILHAFAPWLLAFALWLTFAGWLGRGGQKLAAVPTANAPPE